MIYDIIFAIRVLKGEDHKLANIIDGFLNMLLLSIPEGLATSFICLLLLNDKNMLDLIKIKKNIKNYLILILPQAFILNFIEYVLGINNLMVKFIVGLIIIVGSLSIVQKKFRIITIGIALVSYIILSVGEIIFVLPVLQIFNLTTAEINSNIVYKFLVFLPDRIILLTVLFLIILKFNIDFSKSIILFILRNRSLRIMFFLILGLNIYEFIKNTNYIIEYMPHSKNMIDFALYIIKQLSCPVFNIFVFFILVNYFRKINIKSVDESNIEVK